MTVSLNIGRSFPLGATVVDGGVNFSLFSRSASGVELLLFDREDDGTPSSAMQIDPVTNRTYHYWHVFVPGVRQGKIYGYRGEGPSDPALARLVAANEGFLRRQARAGGIPRETLTDLARRQRPHATFVGCSGSRVPPE
jgi:glycogen operon protein